MRDTVGPVTEIDALSGATETPVTHRIGWGRVNVSGVGRDGETPRNQPERAGMSGAPAPDPSAATRAASDMDAPWADDTDGGAIIVASRSAELTARALRRASESERIAGNAVTLLCDGPHVFACWLHDIATAGRFILLENYIFSGDRIGNRIADALIERAQAGVEVYVLYDWLGSLTTSRQLWVRMARAGIQVRACQPFAWTAPIASLRRNHRKSLCIDGVIGHLGGLCIGDAWAGDPDDPRGPVPPWRDTAVRFAGPAAAELCQAFDDTWSLGGSGLPSRLFHPPVGAGAGGGRGALDLERLAVSAPDCPAVSMTAPVRVIAGIPGRSRIYRLTQVLLSSAASRIWITDAYFLTPPSMYEALTAAARDGVDVRVLVPGRSDLPWIAWAGRAGYVGLLEAGVKVYEWRGPMLHAKTMVVDGKWARIGSSNLNMASLFTNWELDAVIEDVAFGAAMEAQFIKDLSQSAELVLSSAMLHKSAHPHVVPTDSAAAHQPVDATPATSHTVGTVQVRRRSRPGVAVARAGALVLGVALRRPYERSPLSVSMAVTAAMTVVAIGGFYYPHTLGYIVAGLCAWLGVSALLRALVAAYDEKPRQARRVRRGRRNANSTPPTPTAAVDGSPTGRRG